MKAIIVWLYDYMPTNNCYNQWFRASNDFNDSERIFSTSVEPLLEVERILSLVSVNPKA